MAAASLQPARAVGLFVPPVLRTCTRTVMDNTDPDITFDEQGASNWYHQYQEILAALPDEDARARLLAETIRRIKSAGTGRTYDCVVGLSGGVDSSYMCYLAKQWGLRPLIVHFDNGWNDELAVSNIDLVLRKLRYPLQTFVMDWPEFRDLQRAYFKASVLDLDVPTDHMIFGALYALAREHRIKFILSGNNFSTEWLLPRAWYYSKFDLRNLQAIHKRYGERPLKHLPKLGNRHRLYYAHVCGIEDVRILDLVPYAKLRAQQLLKEELGWRDYGGKHYESIFTRFYQGCILPIKYGIDKRKAHLSNLILNGEISREQAQTALAQPADDPERQKSDKRYVAKKLGWSDAEFDAILALPPRRHEEFGTDAVQARIADVAARYVRVLARLPERFQQRRSRGPAPAV